MCDFKMMRKLFFILFVVLSIGFVYSEDLSIKLKTDKVEYVEGEEIKLTLEVSNLNNFDVFGELSGKSNIGNTGFDISCLEFNFVNEQTTSLQVLSAQAQMSTSNTKTITSFSSCGGSQSQSTQTIVDSSVVSSGASEEVVTLNPFSLKYNFNGSEFNIKSNSLDIKIRKKTDEEKKGEQEQREQQEQQEKQEKQEQEQNQQNQNQQQNNQQNTKSSGQQQAQNKNNQNQEQSENQQIDGEQSENDMPELPKGEELSPQKQQALKNNQQNQQSLSQLKNEISKISVNESKLSRKNLSFDNLSLNQSLDELSENKLKDLEEEKKSYLWSIFGLVIFFLVLYLIYLKYFKKEDLIVENSKVDDIDVPYYLELLDLVLVQKDYKNQVKVLAQSVREFLFVSKNLKFVPTNNVGLKITQNEMFLDILKRAERIEFAKASDELDIKDLIKKLKKKYTNKNIKVIGEKNKNE